MLIMKKLFLFSLFFTLSYVLFAQMSLTVVAKNDEKFWLYLNNIRKNGDPVDSIHISDLQRGNYIVKIVLNNNQHSTVTSKLNLRPTENVYVVSYNLRQNRVSLKPQSKDSSISQNNITIQPTSYIEHLQPYSNEHLCKIFFSLKNNYIDKNQTNNLLFNNFSEAITTSRQDKKYLL